AVFISVVGSRFSGIARDDRRVTRNAEVDFLPCTIAAFFCGHIKFRYTDLQRVIAGGGREYTHGQEINKYLLHVHLYVCNKSGFTNRDFGSSVCSASVRRPVWAISCAFPAPHWRNDPGSREW